MISRNLTLYPRNVRPRRGFAGVPHQWLVLEMLAEGSYLRETGEREEDVMLLSDDDKWLMVSSWHTSNALSRVQSQQATSDCSESGAYAASVDGAEPVVVAAAVVAELADAPGSEVQVVSGQFVGAEL